MISHYLWLPFSYESPSSTGRGRKGSEGTRLMRISGGGKALDALALSSGLETSVSGGAVDIDIGRPGFCSRSVIVYSLSPHTGHCVWQIHARTPYILAACPFQHCAICILETRPFVLFLSFLFPPSPQGSRWCLGN